MKWRAQLCCLQMAQYLWILQVFWVSVYVREKVPNLIKFNNDKYKYHALEGFYMGKYKMRKGNARQTTEKYRCALI